MEKVLVLLSTYNGHRYLAQQLDSILAQEQIEPVILVRDDGSTDDTVAIIEHYRQRYPSIELVRAANVGARNSFLELLEMGRDHCRQHPDTGYIALADQDDYWQKEKLFAAITMLKAHRAHMYHSAYQLADEALRPLPTPPIHAVGTLAKALVFNSITGCTCVFTRELLLLYRQPRHPEDVMMHDSYLFKLALACNLPTVCDPVAHILYRQHGNNVVGGTEGALQRLSRRFQNLTSRHCYRSREAAALLDSLPPEATEESRQTLALLAHYREQPLLRRAGIAFSPRFRTGKAVNTTLFALAVLCKTF